MSRDPLLKGNRNDDICDAYASLAAKTTKTRYNPIGVQLYRHEAILQILSKKFYLSPRTIEGIVSEGKREPEDPSQLSLKL